jgi:nucleoside-diphosphate-sugar epimerase
MFSTYSLHTLSARYRISADKAKRELGYRPRPVREAFGDAWTWLREDPMSPLRRQRAA